METETLRSRIGSALSNRDYTDLEVAWREYASLNPEDYDYLLGIAAQLSRHDKGPLASELCLALAEPLLERGETEAAYRAARLSLKTSQRTAGLRELLTKVYLARHASNQNVEAFIEKAGLLGESGSLRQQVEELDRLLTFEEGAYVFHRGGWGYGEVTEFDADTESMTVDFERRRGHHIAIRNATRILERLPDDHIGVYRHFRLDELKRIIEEDPAEVFHIYLRCHGGKATLKQVREELSPAVISKPAWSKWWGRAKRALLRDPQVRIGKGSSPLMELRDKAKPIEVEVAEKMRACASGVEKCAVAREYLRSLDLTPELADAIRGEVLPALDKEPAPTPSRLALLYLQADLNGDDKEDAKRAAADLLASTDEMIAIMATLEPADRKRAVQDVADAASPGWADKITELLRTGDAEIADTAVEPLRHKRPDILVSFFADLIGNPGRNPSMYLWYARGFISGQISPDLVPGEKPNHAIERLLTLGNRIGMEYDRTKDPEAKEFLRQMRNFLTGRRLAMFREFVDGTTADYSRFLHAKILRNRGFTEQTRQAMLDVIEAEHPDINQAPGTDSKTAAAPASDVIYTSLPGYHRQETELRQIVEVEIPAVATDLGRAASFGDISENAEYSAALDKQERIMHRLAMLREQLDRARILQPDEVKTDRVVIGTRVHLRNKTRDRIEEFSILGPWDVDIGQGVISYLSPVGKGLLGKTPGEEAIIELPEEGRVQYEVLDIAIADGLIPEEEESETA